MKKNEKAKQQEPITPDKQESVQGSEEVNDKAISTEESLDQVTAELEELKDRFLRLTAEFSNYRKRSDKEKVESYRLAKADLVKSFLPLLDALDRAQASLADREAKTSECEGIDLLVKQGQECLNQLGVQEIPALHEKFDPQYHEAIQHMDDEQYGENEIFDVLLKGYKIDDYVVRHSVVRVAN